MSSQNTTAYTAQDRLLFCWHFHVSHTLVVLHDALAVLQYMSCISAAQHARVAIKATGFVCCLPPCSVPFSCAFCEMNTCDQYLQGRHKWSIPSQQSGFIRCPSCTCKSAVHAIPILSLGRAGTHHKWICSCCTQVNIKGPTPD